MLLRRLTSLSNKLSSSDGIGSNLFFNSFKDLSEAQTCDSSIDIIREL